MSSLTTNMGLTVWGPNDYYSHTQNQANLTAIDAHDHSTGKGVQISSTGIAPLAIGTNQIKDGAVTSTKLVSNSITGDRLQDGSLPAGKITAGSLNVAQIGQLPQARVVVSSAISVPTATNTALSFTSAVLNTPGSIWSSGQPTRLTASSSGVYYLQGVVAWQTSSAGTIRRIYFRHNGTDVIFAMDSSPSSALVWQNCSGMFYLAANDYVELLAYHDSGSSLNLTSTTNNDAPEARFCWLSN